MRQAVLVGIGARQRRRVRELVPSAFTITTCSMPVGATALFGSMPSAASYQVASKLSTRSSPSVSIVQRVQIVHADLIGRRQCPPRPPDVLLNPRPTRPCRCIPGR